MAEYKLRDGRVLTLRQARGTDAAACLDYLRCVGGESDYLLVGPGGLRDWTEAQEAELLEARFDSAEGRMYLGFVGEELVCIASVETRRHARLSHNATMGLSVRRRFWGLGIGSVCMELLIRFCRAHGGVRSLRLEVYADNERAIRLYKKFGFSVEGCRKRYLCVNGVYHDELLMCLML